MLPKSSLVWGPQLDAWASKGIEGASTFGFAAVLASRKASRRIGRERKSVREKAQGWICCVKFAFGQSPFVVHQPVPV